MRRLLSLVGAACALAVAGPALAAPFSAAEIARVDALAVKALADGGAPSVSIAVVRDGEIAFAKAYGRRSLESDLPATTDSRYMIGSVAKQFTATAVLLLAAEGRLHLEDPVGRYLPETTAADRITLRQALSHTAGYRGYFTLDTTPLEGRSPVSPGVVADRWAKAPLDFEPGARWDYSNTGYTIAGLAVEQVAGQRLADLLQARVFAPLGMTSAGDIDRHPLTAADATGYSRFALGPPRPARAIGPGWLFAVGDLAMTASDLARWDVGVIDRRLMSAAGYEAFETEVKLADGSGSGYGLGVYVDATRGVRRLHHDGSMDGFGSENRIYPDARAAVVVLVNADFAPIQFALADQLEAMLFPPPTATVEAAAMPRPAPAPAGAEELALARALYGQVRAGRIDRDRLMVDVDDYFSETALADYRDSLGPLGDPPGFVQVRRDTIGGLRASLYELTWPDRKLILILRLRDDGKVASFVVFPA
ncbi:MAG: serine hydrolase domain-containing protein [Caulobacter sp.]|nr:serine hydrolase domain-containing protein [Caulobacter sp.]